MRATEVYGGKLHKTKREDCAICQVVSHWASTDTTQVQSQVKWDLCSTRRHRVKFSPNSLLSPANSHSYNCSSFINHPITDAIQCQYRQPLKSNIIKYKVVQLKGTICQYCMSKTSLRVYHTLSWQPYGRKFKSSSVRSLDIAIRLPLHAENRTQ